MSVTSAERTPQWASEYFEGLDLIAEERRMTELESLLPGLGSAFATLIDKLPHTDSGALTEFPVAAGVVKLDGSGRVQTVATALNQTNLRQNSTEHAEMISIKGAHTVLGNKHLADEYLLTTLEPCVMCCGAAVNSGLKGVIFSANHEDIEGKHASVGGQYKKWRTSPKSFNAESYLTESGLVVVKGYMRSRVIERIKRNTYGFKDYYSDPDA
jgi:tRNA(Arg) A34 adenosine deaminase TadA